MREVVAYIGLGSNMGDPVCECLDAVERIARLPQTRVVTISSCYRTSPLGYESQADFVNAVCEIKTVLRPRELLIAAKNIEREMGRLPGERWGPRLIDIDILLYDHEVIDDGDFKVPHPELHHRQFVLIPMCEIAPYVLHPRYGITMKGLLDRMKCDGQRVERITGR